MKKQIKPILFLPFALVAMLLLTVTSAFAAPVQTTPSTNRPHVFPHSGLSQKSQTPRVANASNNLKYGSGSVQGGTTNTYIIFWQPTNNVSSTYHSLIQRYFQDVGTSGLYKNNTQYKDSSGTAPSSSRFAGSWTDTKAYPSSVMQDSDIQAEVTRAQKANGWTSSIHNTFFVFTEKGEDVCLDSGQSQCASNYFCGYHNTFGSNTIYATLPYPPASGCSDSRGPNGDTAADNIISVTSHEQMEAATDPLLYAWRDSNGEEIGDKCNTVIGNVTWNGNQYRVQKEWDNKVSGCVLTGP